MKSILLICCFLWAGCSAPSFWESPEAYLGQRPPGDTPVVFAPQLLSRDSTIALDRVAFSPDGKTFCYCTNTTWFSSTNLKIRYFVYNGSRWEGPAVLNEGFNSPTFSVDGQSLYFPGDDRLGGILWQSNKTAKGWTLPVIAMRRPYSLYDWMPTNSGHQYIGTNGIWGKRDHYDDYDLAVLEPNGHDTTLRRLGNTINTDSSFDGDFFVAPDESYIIQSTRETKDFECELYISFRRPDGTWTAGVSLGPLINNGLAHRWGQYVTPDNKYLFFSQGTSEKDCHIYWVRFDTLLKRLKKKSTK